MKKPTKTKQPPGRPPVEDEDRRDRRVPFVVTQKDFEEIKNAADNAGQTVSTWVRDIVLKAARR